jgi:hypothetical protein
MGRRVGGRVEEEKDMRAFSARGHFQILEPMFGSCAARHSGNIFFSFSLSNVFGIREPDVWFVFHFY